MNNLIDASDIQVTGLSNVSTLDKTGLCESHRQRVLRAYADQLEKRSVPPEVRFVTDPEDFKKLAVFVRNADGDPVIITTAILGIARMGSQYFDSDNQATFVAAEWNHSKPACVSIVRNNAFVDDNSPNLILVWVPGQDWQLVSTFTSREGRRGSRSGWSHC